MHTLPPEPYTDKIQSLLQALGITADMPGQRPLTLHFEPPELVDVPAAADAVVINTYQLTPTACRAWLAMQKAAAAEGIPLALVSAFRSVQRQHDIIANKLAQGQNIRDILSSVAPPGYSEHHTGRAIDIGTSEEAALEEVFETTASYAWLRVHAQAFGFVMSYPRNNPEGFVFEPWHWCYQGGSGPGYIGPIVAAAVPFTQR